MNQATSRATRLLLWALPPALLTLISLVALLSGASPRPSLLHASGRGPGGRGAGRAPGLALQLPAGEEPGARPVLEQLLLEHEPATATLLGLTTRLESGPGPPTERQTWPGSEGWLRRGAGLPGCPPPGPCGARSGS